MKLTCVQSGIAGESKLGAGRYSWAGPAKAQIGGDNNKRLLLGSLSLFKEDEPGSDYWTLINQSKSFSYFKFQSACVQPCGVLSWRV